jgi:hypothetical protein
MIDNLVNMTGYRHNHSGFVRKFLPEKYRTFPYKNGKTDLPEQMEYVLRNGLVHSLVSFQDERQELWLSVGLRVVVTRLWFFPRTSKTKGGHRIAQWVTVL